MKSRYFLYVSFLLILSFSSAQALNLKDVIFSNPNYGKVTFDHNHHIKQEGIRTNCKTCHNVIFNMRNKTRFTMADMEKGKSCGACHNGKRAFAVGDCNKCHKAPEVSIKVAETGPVSFSHKIHSRNNQCGSCHPKIYERKKNKPVGMDQMEKGKSCGACHNGKTAFKTEECLRCHPYKDVDFKVKDTGNVQFSHDLHTAMFKCSDCHVKLYLPSEKNKRASMADMEAAKSCGACHDGSAAFTVKENCDRCHKM